MQHVLVLLHDQILGLLYLFLHKPHTDELTNTRKGIPERHLWFLFYFDGHALCEFQHFFYTSHSSEPSDIHGKSAVLCLKSSISN